jgi:hypothetical protein
MADMRHTVISLMGHSVIKQCTTCYWYSDDRGVCDKRSRLTKKSNLCMSWSACCPICLDPIASIDDCTTDDGQIVHRDCLNRSRLYFGVSTTRRSR